MGASFLGRGLRNRQVIAGLAIAGGDNMCAQQTCEEEGTHMHGRG
jgi:hypothetical protein